MRDPDRIETFLTELAKLWHLVPDWRFGQLICNTPFDRDPFFMEEDEFLGCIKKMFKDFGFTEEDE